VNVGNDLVVLDLPDCMRMRDGFRGTESARIDLGLRVSKWSSALVSGESTSFRSSFGKLPACFPFFRLCFKEIQQ
jgi:hypothetical protein